MASMLDYFTPGQMPQNPQPDQNIMPAVSTFMNNPQALNALLAFGTQAMVPQWGGGTVQFAKGVGAAGEAASANEESARKLQETESKGTLREAQAGAAEARANTAGTRAALTGQIEEGKRERALTANKVRLTNMYTNYVRAVDARNKAAEAQNNNPLRPPGAPPTPPERAMPIDEWVQKNPLVKDLGLAGPSTAAPTGDGEGDILPSNATPDVATTPPASAAPQNPVVGQTYPSPRGPVKYLGNDRWGPP